MLSLFRPAISLFVVLSVLTGLVYPLLVTGVAQTFFPRQANGSLIFRSGQPVGSELIGQQFSGEKHFWGRPSATTPVPFNAQNSSGSNLGPANPALVDTVKARVKVLEHAHPGYSTPVPVDLVTASGSGLDPHISGAAAFYQVDRVAKACGLAQEDVRKLVDRHLEKPVRGGLRESQVNVLKLNLALDELCS